MKMKKVLVVFALVLQSGNSFTQEARDSWRIYHSVNQELKNIWSEPDEDFKSLSNRAMRDDPQALYALSQVCKAKGIDYETWHKYLTRAAELRYVKAQLRLVMDCFCEGTFRGSSSELQEAKTHCANAVAAGYLCVTNLIPLLDESIRKNKAIDQEEKRKKEERARMKRELRLAEARQNGIARPFKPFVEEEKMSIEDATARVNTNDAVACYWLAYHYRHDDPNSATRFLEKAVKLGYAQAAYLLAQIEEGVRLKQENGLPTRDVPDFDDIRCCWGDNGTASYLNSNATAYVESLYKKAIDGGLIYATNDIARLKKKIAACKEHSAQTEKALAMTGSSVTESVPLISGVTAPLIPYEAKDKIKYEDAVERAKKGDAESYYWLAYYFLNGDGVERDLKSAGKFLQKAIDVGNAKASYLVGLYHAFYSLLDEKGVSEFGGRRGELLSRKEFDEINGVLKKAGMNRDIDTLQMPSQNEAQENGIGLLGWRNRGNRGRYCFTNDVATGYVMGLYLSAVKGGLSYATNDIARVKRAIAKCSERIAAKLAAEKAAKEKGVAALNLLGEENPNKQEEAEKEERKRQEAERERQYEERRQQREYWSTWPEGLGEEYAKLVLDAEKKFNCVIDNSGNFTNVWTRGGNKSLIVGITGDWRHDRYCKIDSEGKIVAWTSREEDFEELKWVNEEKSKRLDALRAKWAEERGMTLEEAILKRKQWQTNGHSGAGGILSRPGAGGLLFRRRMEREIMRRQEQQLRSDSEDQRQQLKALQDDEQRAIADREAQRQQLMAIKDELLKMRNDKERNSK